MKFGRDRRRWTAWLFEARKRYGLEILNYIVTSNHIHLLVFAGEDRLTIPRSLQLIEGRTAQQFNLRKGRKGAFWEDRYHATAVESGKHLKRCMNYIDMNMVRAGVVDHPRQWKWCGYREIQTPPQRYTRINRALLSRLLDLPSPKAVAEWQEESLAQALINDDTDIMRRRSEWTEGIAVGSQTYVEGMKSELGTDSSHRHVESIGDGDGDAYMLREESIPYRSHYAPENSTLSHKNTLFWRLTA